MKMRKEDLKNNAIDMGIGIAISVLNSLASQGCDSGIIENGVKMIFKAIDEAKTSAFKQTYVTVALLNKVSTKEEALSVIHFFVKNGKVEEANLKNITSRQAQNNSN